MMWEKFKTFMGGLMFQVFIGFVVGMILMGYGMNWYTSHRINEAIWLGAFIHNKQIYNITVRP